MPIYTYKCECGAVEEVCKTVSEIDRKEVCQCGKEMVRKPSLPTPHIFKPDWWEHIAPEPIYIESKEQLIRECAKHDCYAPAYQEIGPSQHGVHVRRVGYGDD